MHIAIINQSTRVSQEQAEAMVRAVDRQLREHWAPAWDREVPGVSLETIDSLKEGMCGLYIFESIETANLLGYHTKTPTGVYYGRVSVSAVLDNGGAVLFGGAGVDTVSAALSHEAIEMAVDANVSTWVDGPFIPQGCEYAYEPCDPVQQDFYVVKGGTQDVMVSNFVLPSWFEANAVSGPFDYMNRLQAPFSMSQGGYVIVRQPAQNEQQVHGAVVVNGSAPRWKMAGKLAPGASRTYRRIG